MEILKRGSRGEAVVKLQRLLGIGDDGIFGYGTERAVKDFQRSRGLYPDGIVGKATWGELLKGITDDADISIIDGHINTHITLALGRKIKYIAIHYTAGSTSKRGTAMAIRNVFITRQASADYIVDDAEIVRINPDVRNYYCWAVGDKLNSTTGGGRLHGVATNKNTISIEICSTNKTGRVTNTNDSNWYFTDAVIDNCIELTKKLMEDLAEIVRVLNVVSVFAFAPTDLIQFLRVRRRSSADHNHRIRLFRQRESFFLSLLCCIANGIRNYYMIP